MSALAERRLRLDVIPLSLDPALRDGRAWLGILTGELYTAVWEPWQDDLAAPKPATPALPYVSPTTVSSRASASAEPVSVLGEGEGDPWLYPSIPEDQQTGFDVFVYTDPPGTPWKVFPQRYKPGRGVRASMSAYRCPSFCMAAARALALHHLDWKYHLVLTAPPGQFSARLAAWLPGLDALRLRTGPELRQPFYLMVLATADPDPARVTILNVRNIHAHVLLGGVSWADAQSVRSSWGNGYPYIKRIDRPFGILHYVHAQTKEPKEHMKDIRSYSHALLTPPIQSPNLDPIAIYYGRALRRLRAETARKAGKRSARSIGKAGRRARARRAALASWSPASRALRILNRKKRGT